MNQYETRAEALRTEATQILERTDGPLTDDDKTRLDAIETELADLNARSEALTQFRGGAFESGDGNTANFQTMSRNDPWSGGDLHRAEGSDLRSRALTAVERMAGSDEAREAATAVVERNGSDVARWALVASAPAYVSAFEKVLRDPVRGHLAWTEDEAAAYRDVYALEQRLGSVGSDAAGGYAVPTHLDPAFVLTNAGTSNPYRAISTVKQLANGNVWNGVTTAGVTASFDTEGAEVSDDTPTLGRTSIPVHRLAAFVGGSFELIDDVPGLGEEVGRAFVDAADRIEAEKFTKGSGTNEPTGIVTAVYAESSRRYSHATNSAMTITDVVGTQNALDPRWQKRASWTASLSYLNRVRLLGSSSYSTWSARLDEPIPNSILGRAAYEVSEMSTALNTSTNTAFVYGDWSQYLIVDRVGARVVFYPYLVGSSGRPTGQAGWFMYRRVGAEPVTTTAFVISSNPGA
jgi:HK97 family phage major capsid protein